MLLSLSLKQRLTSSILKISIIIIFISYSSIVFAQDFKIVVDIDSCCNNTQIKLYSVKKYDIIKLLKVDDFIAKGFREENHNRWIIKGTTNDSTSLFRLHIGNYHDTNSHVYARTTSFLSLVKGDSVYLRFPNSYEFFNYEVKNSQVNSTLENVFEIDYKLWHLDDRIINLKGQEKKKLLDERNTLLKRKITVIDTISNSDAFFVLINPEIRDHSKNLLFFKNNDLYSDKITDEFSSSLFSKQMMKDIDSLNSEDTFYKYWHYFLLAILCLLGFILYRRRKNINLITLLSPNERIIFEMIAKGKTNKEIAESKFTQVSTVKKQVSSIYKKLNVKNRTEATNYYNTHKS